MLNDWHCITYGIKQKNQHMTILYNISILTFLVDYSFPSMPTEFDRGGKNSLNHDKNPQLPKTPDRAKNPQGCQKSPRLPKIPNRQKSLAAKNPLANPKWPTKNVAKTCQFFSEFWSTMALN